MNDKTFEFQVDLTQEGMRLDRVLVHFLGGEEAVSRSQIQRWIERGAVTLNGNAVLQATKVKNQDKINIKVPPETLKIAPEPLDLEVLYEDSAVIVVNKPAGQLTHPAGGEWKGTLANAVAHHILLKPKEADPLWQKPGDLRPGIVHRLDRDTSGVLVVGKTTRVMENLARQFRDRTIEKIYLALTCGVVAKKSKTAKKIVGSIGRQAGSKKLEISTAGRSAETEFFVKDIFPKALDGRGASYLEIHPKSGRTHQIRVHLQSIGFPILGDALYGGDWIDCPRQMLHALKLTFTHPLSKKRLSVSAPIPPDFKEQLARLKHVV